PPWCGILRSLRGLTGPNRAWLLPLFVPGSQPWVRRNSDASPGPESERIHRQAWSVGFTVFPSYMRPESWKNVGIAAMRTDEISPDGPAGGRTTRPKGGPCSKRQPPTLGLRG